MDAFMDDPPKETIFIGDDAAPLQRFAAAELRIQTNHRIQFAALAR